MLFPLDRNRLFKPPAQRIYDRENRLIRMHLSPDGYWRFPVKRDEIPEILKQAILCFEDRYFYFHLGINPIALIRAAWHNLSTHRLMGGSTITMQVARMMNRKPRTLQNKLAEIFTALQLEYHFKKSEILDIYLNLAPYGGNIEGVAAAAHFYFNKPLHALSISEIAILTIIPKNPNANRPDRANDLSSKRQRVIAALITSNVIKPDQARRALQEPIQGRRQHATFRAPHFSRSVAQDREGHAIIRTAFYLPLYEFTRQLLQTRVDQLRTYDVHNAAAVIIHNPSMTVRAYVGSQSFYDQQHGGQNDGARMIRSPGSALKPFVYARALDTGLITPKQKLFDLPFYIKHYEPKNFNDRFFGIVPADEALQGSLNIPAIALNLLLGDASLYELIQQAGILSVHRPKAYYGAGIAVGNVEISLLDLTRLYTAFANNGSLRPLVYDLSDSSKHTAIPLFSAEAAFLVSEILADGFRKEMSAYWESGADIPKVAFKTGTSSKNRDLLTIGYNKEFTVGVWLGNFNGRPTEELTGIDATSDVVFDIFRYLSQNNQFAWFQQPRGLTQTEICTDPIILDGGCRTMEMDWIIDGVDRIRPCKLLRAEVLAHLMESGLINTMDDLKFHPCYEQLVANAPKIVSPYDKEILTLDRYRDDVFQKIQLKCFSFQPDPTVYWFIDREKPLLSRSGDDLFVNLNPGNHQIACMDSSAKINRSQILITKE